MALEQAKEFLDKLISNDEMKETFSQINPADAPERAKEMGYHFTLEELETAEKEVREKDRTDPEQLNANDLDSMAGGGFWQGEDAPDGHEMGCVVTYHRYNWQKENNIWCNSAYYCISSNRIEDTQIGPNY